MWANDGLPTGHCPPVIARHLKKLFPEWSAAGFLLAPRAAAFVEYEALPIVFNLKYTPSWSLCLPLPREQRS